MQGRVDKRDREKVRGIDQRDDITVWLCLDPRSIYQRISIFGSRWSEIEISVIDTDQVDFLLTSIIQIPSACMHI